MYRVVSKAFAGDALNWTLVQVDSYLLPVIIMDEFGEVNLAHHGRHNMAVLQMEVVVGAVEVGGHYGNIIGAVLQVVALAHLQACNLGNGILLVGIFQRAGQQTVLLHRLGSVLGIDAGAT